MKHIIISAMLIFTAQFGLADEKGMISVTGKGVVSSAPDMAIVRLGVTTLGKDAAAALGENSQTMAVILQTLLDRGIAKKDIQTSQLSLHPRWERQTNSNRAPKIIGYQASNNLQLRLRDLTAVGPVLDALGKLGVNQIQGISFGLQNSDALLKEARIAAVKNAREKAELYAAAAGVTLGKLQSLSEAGAAQPVRQYARMEAMAADGGVPIAEGELDIHASVSMRFEIE